LGVVFALLAAGASAKTLKITKSEVVQHRSLEAVQRPPAPAEPVAPAILRTNLQKLRGEGALP
jgi:hypothetical protein